MEIWVVFLSERNITLAGGRLLENMVLEFSSFEDFHEMSGKSSLETQCGVLSVSQLALALGVNFPSEGQVVFVLGVLY